MDEKNTENMEVIDFNGYEPVSLEMFAHEQLWIQFSLEKEPKITIPKGCINFLEHPKHVTLLVHPEQKKLALINSDGIADKKSMYMEVPEEGFISVPCAAFYRKLSELMDWEGKPCDKRRLYGRPKEFEGKPALEFSLLDGDVFVHMKKDELKSLTRIVPESWKADFGEEK